MPFLGHNQSFFFVCVSLSLSFHRKLAYSTKCIKGVDCKTLLRLNLEHAVFTWNPCTLKLIFAKWRKHSSLDLPDTANASCVGDRVLSGHFLKPIGFLIQDMWNTFCCKIRQTLDACVPTTLHCVDGFQGKLLLSK